jgi:transcriptional regulator with XRE-family HTH domain
MPEITDLENISKIAREARTALHLTQEDVAERVGVSVEFYSRIERGVAFPGLGTLIRMAVVLKVSTDRLIGFDTEDIATRLIERFAPKPIEDPPDLRALFRNLRTSAPSTRRLVTLIVNELEKPKGRRRSKGAKKVRRARAKGADKAKAKARGTRAKGAGSRKSEDCET